MEILAFAFGSPGWQELVIVGIIAILLFGNRLPKIARSMGSSLIEFKKGVKGIENDIDMTDVDKTIKDTVNEVKEA